MRLTRSAREDVVRNEMAPLATSTTVDIGTGSRRRREPESAATVPPIIGQYPGERAHGGDLHGLATKDR